MIVAVPPKSMTSANPRNNPENVFGGRVRITSCDEIFFSSRTLKISKNENTKGNNTAINNGNNNALQMSIKYLSIRFISLL